MPLDSEQGTVVRFATAIPSVPSRLSGASDSFGSSHASYVGVIGVSFESDPSSYKSAMHSLPLIDSSAFIYSFGRFADVFVLFSLVTR